MFFITGLPRSRTAWFAAFMSASGYPCYHEAINGCKSIQEYKDKIKNKSDSTTAFGLMDIPLNRPVLIIHRKEKHPDEFDSFYEKLKDIKGLHVDFDDINDKMPDIFKFLTGSNIDSELFDLFKSIKIETMIAYDKESIKSLFKDMGYFKG